MIDGFGAQFVVPGFVAVDLAQAVPGAVLGEPRRGIAPDVDRVPRHVRRRVGGRNPSGSFLLRPVLRDRIAEELFLVLRGTPAAVDEEPDPVVRGIGCRPAQGTAESGIEVGDTRNLVVVDRRAVGNGTAALAKRITRLVRGGVDARRGRRGRGHRQGRRHQRLGAESCGDRHHGDEHAGGTAPVDPDPTGRCSCRSAAGHAAIEGSVVLRGRMRFSICRRYAPARRLRACAC